jgi:chemotaxis protein methyltransferase CheR
MSLSSKESDLTIPLLADLVQERTGIFFKPERYEVLVEKLSPLAIERNCSSLLDYFFILKYDPQAEKEWSRVYSALAVNETYFWREFDQIDALVNEIVPNLQRKRPGVPVRIWNAACASGEEPYSVAIALKEAGRFQAGPVEISATDFNQAALEKARAGEYRLRSFRALPPALLARYFTHLTSGQGETRYRLAESIQQLVNFSYLNLLDEKGMAKMGGYDMIMCRNAFIYFSDSAIRQVLESFYQALNPEGLLFVASAESLLRYTNQFDLIEIAGAFAYRKTSETGLKLP